MLRAYKYRLYPTKKQVQALQGTLDLCRELYNAAVQERRDAWRMCGKSITYYEQVSQLPEIKQIREEFQGIYGQVLQHVLRRVDRSFQAFFRRCKTGKKAGFPRFKGKGRYDSFTYPQVGKVQGNRILFPSIGSIKVKWHRPIEGTIKTCAIKREDDQWYVIFSCEAELEPLPVSPMDVGVDLGVTHFAALSDGTIIDHPRYYRKAQKKLERLQQALSRKKRSSHRRDRARKLVSKAHKKIRNQRRDFLHKQSRKLVNQYQTIVFEELQTADMTKCPKPKQDEATGRYLPNGAGAKAGLNKSILDAGWGMFQQMCIVKAVSAGRSVLFVNPYKTSQLCSNPHCGKEVPKPLEERWHLCPYCGLSLDRDVNAAINILRLGRSQRSSNTL